MARKKNETPAAGKETPAAYKRSVSIGELSSHSLESLVISPLNPRSIVEDEPLRALADSIASEGLLENLIGRPNPSQKGKIEILAGGRRLRALQLLADEGHTVPDIPVLVRELDDTAAFAVAMAENLARRDIDFVDECVAFKVALDQAKRGDGAAERIAAAVGKGVRMVQQCAAIGGLEPEFFQWYRLGFLNFDRLRAWTQIPKELREQFIPSGIKIAAVKNEWQTPIEQGRRLEAKEIRTLPSVVPKESLLAPSGKWGKDLGNEFVWVRDMEEFKKAQEQAFENAATKAGKDEVFSKEKPAKITDPKLPGYVKVNYLKEDGTVAFDYLQNRARSTTSQGFIEESPDSQRERAKAIKTRQLQMAALKDSERGLRLALLMLLGTPELGAQVSKNGYSRSSMAQVPLEVATQVERTCGTLVQIDPALFEARAGRESPRRILSSAPHRPRAGGEADRRLWEGLERLKEKDLVAAIAAISVYWVDLWVANSTQVDWPLVAAIAESWSLRDPKVLDEDFLTKYPKPSLVELAVESGAFTAAAEIGDQTRAQLAKQIMANRRPDWLPALLEFRSNERAPTAVAESSHSEDACEVCGRPVDDSAYGNDDYAMLKCANCRSATFTCDLCSEVTSVEVRGHLDGTITRCLACSEFCFDCDLCGQEFPIQTRAQLDGEPGSYRCDSCREAVAEKGPDWRPLSASDDDEKCVVCGCRQIGQGPYGDDGMCQTCREGSVEKALYDHFRAHYRPPAPPPEA